MFDVLRKIKFNQLKQALLAILNYSQLLKPYCRIHSLHFGHVCGREIGNQKKGITNFHWIFNGIENYNIDLTYHKFHMIFSHSCTLNSLQVKKSFRNCTNQMTYCGHLPPWNETCSCTSVTFGSVQTIPDLVHGFDISYFISRTFKYTLRTNILLHQGFLKLPLKFGYGNMIHHNSTIHAYVRFKMLIEFDHPTDGSNSVQGTWLVILPNFGY